VGKESVETHIAVLLAMGELGLANRRIDHSGSGSLLLTCITAAADSYLYVGRQRRATGQLEAPDTVLLREYTTLDCKMLGQTTSYGYVSGDSI
jgi:hypothetical protein